MLSHLCEISNVSRLGFYRYFSKPAVEKRLQRESSDIIGIIYNLKRIRRIMKK